MNQEETSSENSHRRKTNALKIFGAVLITGLILIFAYMVYRQTHITSDDAFVQGAIHVIAPRVSGTVLKVHVSDNQSVHAGDLLVGLEPDLFIQKVREAEAELEAEQQRASELNVMIDVQEKKVLAAAATLGQAIAGRDERAAAEGARKAEVAAKQSLLRQAELDLRRAESLFTKEVIPRERLDRAQTAYETAAAELKVADELKKQAAVSQKSQESLILQAEASLTAEKGLALQVRSSLKTQEERIKGIAAKLNIAKLNLSYTKISSPADGYVTRKNVEVGNQVQPGQPLMAVVPLKDVYVIANYKETEIERIKPGQKVKIRVDAYPGRAFSGKVESIMAGTGAVFSLFPAENATGNYVKVVQRIPVRILLDKDTDPDHALRVGMSVVPTVYVK